ncbi:patatin-like phospholipase family protein [Marinobacter sp. NP-4(2019)]|uniref:patatin-like phospholipase family protein n=1 Tax=Marinobacter sp. NP-4(2019) TaxID=2488665 RepID=UPI000FC3E69B|nr:patatin-like phospholipase family protein [Marinobacter sp. NP-4(2019)]AZT83906.1 patatin-like phospholipase family protein [Marinobacter sp. NP-4(2019)]
MTSKVSLSNKKVGLALGCGAVAGAAWSVPILAELQRQLAWDARSADVLIGTSVGAVLAALLSAGVSIDDMESSLSSKSKSSGCDWDHDTSWGPWHPSLPKLQFSGLPLLRKGLRGEVPPLTAICGVLPKGQFDMTPFRQLINAHVSEGQWSPHDNCWIMAVDNDSGERVGFGRPDAPDASLVDAVCASYGVPAWCPPVEIGGRTYLDGGITSPVSADLLADSDLDVVIVVAPMSSRTIEANPSLLARIERVARRYMTRIVDREVALLRRAGKQVIRLEPSTGVLQAIGYNMMDSRRRHRVFESATKTASAAVEQALSEATIPQHRS